MNFVWFIADLHLGPLTKPLLNQFINLLNDLPSNLSAIYILGDLFYLWYGDDNNEEYLVPIKRALQNATSKIHVYLVRGNRDFLLGQQFAKETGIQYLEDPSFITLFQQPILVTHGDLLYSSSVYLLIRKKLRNHQLITWFKKIPLQGRKLLTHGIKRLFRLFKGQKKPILLNQFQLADWLKRYPVPKYIIAGHIHQKRQEVIENTTIITLNDWQKNQQQILEWYENHTWQFKNIN